MRPGLRTRRRHDELGSRGQCRSRADLAGNSLMSSRPPVAMRMRSIASCARTLTGWVGSCPVARRYRSSAAEACPLRMAHRGAAALAPSTLRRVIRDFGITPQVSLCSEPHHAPSLGVRIGFASLLRCLLNPRPPDSCPGTAWHWSAQAMIRPGRTQNSDQDQGSGALVEGPRHRGYVR